MYYKVVAVKGRKLETVVQEIKSRVDNEIARGWKPLGGVSLTATFGLYVVCQAMTYSDWD